MRIVGGRLRGRALAAPKSNAIRPTADRVRESLFNILAHAYGDPMSGARVLDLFAGLRGWSDAWAARGHGVRSLDFDPRFEVTYHRDIEIDDSEVVIPTAVKAATPGTRPIIVAGAYDDVVRQVAEIAA